MKRIYRSLICGVILAALQACHKDATQTGSNGDYTTGITNIRTWSRIEAQSGGATIGIADYTDTLADTSFSMYRVSDSAITFQSSWPTLHLATIDSAAQAAVFDSITTGSFSAVLTYYYTHDSLTFGGHRFKDTSGIVLDHSFMYHTHI